MRSGYADDPARRDTLVLLGVRPESMWLARVLAAAVLISLLETVLTVAAVVLLDLRVGAAGLHAAAVVVTSLGLGALGVFARDIAEGTRSGFALVPLMEAHGPDRLICVTGIGTGDSWQALSTLERIGHSVVFSKVYGDKTRQEDIVKRSSLRWTLVRPTILTSNPRSGRYKVLVRPETWRMGVISRADVADFVIRALDDDATVRTSPVLAR